MLDLPYLLVTTHYSTNYSSPSQTIVRKDSSKMFPFLYKQNKKGSLLSSMKTLVVMIFPPKNHLHPPATQDGIAIVEKGSLKQSPVTTEGAVS